MDGEGQIGKRRFSSPLHCGRQLVAEEGLMSLYRGLTASVIREVGACVLYAACPPNSPVCTAGRQATAV